MNTVMTCDDVFDILTRQPFPSGSAEDALVELHLGACHECRCLAEALRPAVGLIHESMHETDDQSLPAYRGVLAEAGVHRILDRSAGSATAVQRGRAPRVERAAAFGGGVLAGIVAAMVIWVVAGGDGLRGGTGVAVMGSSGSRMSLPGGRNRRIEIPDDTGRVLLGSLQLKPCCFSSSSADQAGFDAVAVSEEMREFVCCTMCHSAGTQLTGAQSTRRVTRACAACHRAAPLDSFGAGWREIPPRVAGLC